MSSRFDLTRRALLASGLGISALWLAGCASKVLTSPKLPDQTPTATLPTSYTDSTDALWNVLLPAERDADGTLVSPGAREAGVDVVLVGENVVAALAALGLVPRLLPETIALFDDFTANARPLLNAELDALATLEHPLQPFSALTMEQQLRIVDHARADAKLGPTIEAARAVCFLAYLGAVTNDLGLQAVGFPPFEDFAARVAVSGYPRTTAAGDVEDYTYDRAPAATTGDDLSTVVDGNGDLR